MHDEASALDLARQGDLAAFNALVLEYQALVYSLCLRMLGSRAPAEDAAQETFLAAWRNIRGLRGERFRPWLLRIAANACRDELRRRGRRPATSLEASLAEGAPEPADPLPLPETAALSSELRGRIERALAVLPEDQRLAVLLRDVQGLDYDEIARVMRSSPGTVKSRISRGRARLRELLLGEAELLPQGVRPK